MCECPSFPPLFVKPIHFPLFSRILGQSAQKCLCSFLSTHFLLPAPLHPFPFTFPTPNWLNSIRMHQQRLLVRARALARLKSLPDPLLGHLLSQSDPLPERVPQGVILFRQGERIQDWYLLLSGEVELFLEQFPNQQQLAIVRPGTIFGEIASTGQCHSCAAKIQKSAEFVRIGQNHFLSLYNKWADQLQPCMLPMEDLTAIPGPSNLQANGQRKVSGRQLPRSPSERRRNRNAREEEENRKIGQLKNGNGGSAHLNGFSRDRGEGPKREKKGGESTGHSSLARKMEGKTKRERDGGIHLLDLGPANPSIEEKIQIAVGRLGGAMSAQPNSQVIGSEFCANFHVLWVQCLRQPPSSHLVPIGVGQALLDRAYLFPARADHQPQFLNSPSANYHWTLPPSNNGDGQNSEDSLLDSLLLLANVGADSLLQSILRKSEEQRTEDELELVHAEMNHIRAFNHLSRGMKRGLAKVLGMDSSEHAGTVIFREGEPARSWFVVLRGTLEAKANGRRSILREGDDFGKLALLNGNPGGNGQIKSRRQATVVTAQDGCQLLRVDSADFQRILRGVESDTIRLKEAQKDVLVLQRDPKGGHSLVAGLPEKILEYILETRIELGPEDSLLEEALLTQPLWMPSNRLCDALKVYYATGSLGSSAPEFDCWPSNGDEFEQSLAAKRRAVQFVVFWQKILGPRFFLDPIANSFVEEMYSCLLEDAGRMGEMAGRLDSTIGQMQHLMAIREKAMQRLCWPSRLVLNCGAYSSNAPATSPVLPSDICNQAILLPDSSQITLQIRLDQSANQIANLARLGRQNRPIDGRQMGQNDEECCLLFELTPDGQRLPISGEECSVPTMLSPGSILLAALPSEIAQIPIFPFPSKPISSANSSLVLLLGPDRLARAMALFHFKLLNATSEAELMVQLLGRDQFPSRLAPSNLDLLLRRFGQLQLWATSEVLLAPDLAQRLAVLRGLVQLGQKAKDHRDLLAMAALCLGLSTLSISRLGGLWSRLPGRIGQIHGQNQALLWPPRDHRNYRFFAGALRSPLVPFVPLLLKEMDFLHEGRPSHLADGLVSWEKMHILGRVLRTFRQAKGPPELIGQIIEELGRDKQTQSDEALVKNLHTIEDQNELTRISTGIQQREGI